MVVISILKCRKCKTFIDDFRFRPVARQLASLRILVLSSSILNVEFTHQQQNFLEHVYNIGYNKRRTLQCWSGNFKSVKSLKCYHTINFFNSTQL